MRWLNWLISSNANKHDDDIDVSGEVTATKIKSAEVRAARIRAEKRTEEFREDIDYLVKEGKRNHFGESFQLAMMLRRYGA